MLGRLAAAVALAAVAVTTSAQAPAPDAPYSPPQMTWGPPSGPGPGRAPVDPVPASSTASSTAWGANLSAGLAFGALLREGQAAGGLDVALAAVLGRFTVGGRVFTAGTTRGGLGIAATAGPSFPLGAAHRLDLALDAGVLRHNSPGPGSDPPRPLAVVAARAGLGWGRRPGAYVSFGAIAQLVQRTDTGGGAMLGTYLSVGHRSGGE